MEFVHESEKITEACGVTVEEMMAFSDAMSKVMEPKDGGSVSRNVENGLTLLQTEKGQIMVLIMLSSMIHIIRVWMADDAKLSRGRSGFPLTGMLSKLPTDSPLVVKLKSIMGEDFPGPSMETGLGAFLEGLIERLSKDPDFDYKPDCDCPVCTRKRLSQDEAIRKANAEEQQGTDAKPV